MRDFRKSQEQAYRRLVREFVRKGPFSKSERDVALAIVNLWFHWKAKGAIRPTRETLAKKADVSVRTVAGTVAKLRDAQILVPLSGGNGGRSKATEYRLSEYRLLEFCGADLDAIFSELTSSNRANLHGIAPQETVQILHTHIDTNHNANGDVAPQGGKVVPLPIRKAGGHV